MSNSYFFWNLSQLTLCPFMGLLFGLFPMPARSVFFAISSFLTQLQGSVFDNFIMPGKPAAGMGHMFSRFPVHD